MVIGSLLVGCDLVGPAALQQSRPDYNEVIRQTAKNQNFLNLVRVYNHESTLFMDVSEVDVALQFQGSVNGTVALPQARGVSGAYSYSVGHDYLLGGTLQYLETPTIRYLPLSGQALFAQISAPISVDSIAAMIDSQWPVSAVFQFAVTRLTPVDKDYYEALDGIIFLSNYNALEIVPVHADPATSGPNDALKLYLLIGGVRNEGRNIDYRVAQRAKAIWHRLWEIYGPSQPPNVQERDYCIELRTAPRSPQWGGYEAEMTKEENYLTTQPAEAVKKITTEWRPKKEAKPDPKVDRATTEPADDNVAYNMNPDDVSSAITLTPSNYPPYLRPYQLMPIIRIRSALGILRDLTQPDLDWDLVAFIRADHNTTDEQSAIDDVHRMIEKFHADFPRGYGRDYYIFDASKMTGHINKTYNVDPSQDEEPWKRSRPDWNWPIDDLPHTPAYATTQVDSEPAQTYSGVQDYYQVKDRPERGDRYRHYMIVFYQDDNKPLPANVFVSARCDGRCFYIDGDDIVSQRNFALMCHFLMIQAVPQSAPLTPTIGIGATH
jgi:hypothetical protein